MFLKKIFTVSVLLLSGVSMLFAESRYTQLYNEICGIVEGNFYDEDIIQKQFGGIRNKYTNRLKSVRSDAEFAVLVNSMLGELKASHTQYYTKNTPEYYQLCSIFEFMPAVKTLFNEKPVVYPGTGISAREIDGKVFVVSVLEGSPAQKAGMVKGDEIISLNGKRFVPAQYLAGIKDTPFTLQLRRAKDCKPFKIEVLPSCVNPKSEALLAEKESIKVFESGGRKIGYIHIWSYAGEEYHQEFLDAILYGKLKDADALIWDLRDGWGGANPEYLNVFNGKVPVLESIERNGTKSGYDPQWRKPVVMLVNSGVRSGKEILAYGFKKYDIGKIIGEKTAGAVLGGKPFIISDGSLLYLAGRKVEVDGETLEGKGVEPDIAVPMDIRYIQGKDPQLEHALQYISGSLTNDQDISRKKLANPHSI